MVHFHSFISLFFLFSLFWGWPDSGAEGGTWGQVGLVGLVRSSNRQVADVLCFLCKQFDHIGVWFVFGFRVVCLIYTYFICMLDLVSLYVCAGILLG